MGFRIWGFGFRVSGLGFEVWGLGFGVWGLGFGGCLIPIWRDVSDDIFWMGEGRRSHRLKRRERSLSDLFVGWGLGFGVRGLEGRRV